MSRISLVMIVRDEAETLGRCLESARPHVERILVLDTGSVDGTSMVAEAWGAEVHAFAWRDDFAAARNAALDLSDADWNLILDADEWLEDATALAPAALAALSAGPAIIGQARVVSEMEGGVLSGSWIPRLLPRGVRYRGRIHEQPDSGLPQAPLPLRIGHSGYSAAALARKAGRNEALLMAELDAYPDDGYLWFQLAKEHQARGKRPQAALCFSEALRLTPPDASWRHALVVRAICGLKEAGRFDEAVAIVEAELPNWPASPDFFFVVGDLYLEIASREPERALDHHLPVVEFAWKKCLEIGERTDLDGAVSGRGSHMAAHNLAAFYGVLGRQDLEREYGALAQRLRLAA